MSSENILHTRRRFTYAVRPEKIRQYLEDLGYSTIDAGSTEKVVGFDVDGTTIRVDFDLKVQDQVVGKGMVSVANNEFTTAGDMEKAQRSLQLYKKLYTRFRERPD